MQTAVFSSFAPLVAFTSPHHPFAPFCNVAAQRRTLDFVSLTSLSQRRFAQPVEQDYVAYDGKTSVFPAEACEEVGGESCEVGGVGPEVKPKATALKDSVTSPLAGKEREYVEYSEEKTVFPGEACDELGGEFCESEYQNGVFPDKGPAK